MQYLSQHPGKAANAKLVPKMHTTGIRLISVLEFSVACEVAVIETIMKSLNSVLVFSDTVANPKNKSKRMVGLIERQLRMNDDANTVSQLLEIDFKKFNINVNVGDLMYLARMVLNKLYDNDEGYHQILKNLEREYMIKKLNVSYRSMEDILNIVIPTYNELCDDASLTDPKALNPRAQQLADSVGDPQFTDLLIDIKNEFCKEQDCECQYGSLTDKQVNGD